jgi:hypothetical protein
MTVKEGLSKLAACLGSNFHKVGEAVMKADMIGLIKLGVVVGVSVAVLILIFKFLRDKKKSYHDESGKTPVDKSLELNFHDARNRDKLHPLMKKVKKNLTKDLKPRKTGKGKSRKGYRKDVIRRYSENLKAKEAREDEERLRRETERVNADLFDFIEHADEYMDTHPNDDDHHCLFRVWNGTR